MLWFQPSYVTIHKELKEGLAGFLSLIAFILGLSFIVGGIILLLWKERSLVIETHAGTQIRFKNPGITDRDIGAIFSQFAEEYKKKPEAEKQSTQQPWKGFPLPAPFMAFSLGVLGVFLL